MRVTWSSAGLLILTLGLGPASAQTSAPAIPAGQLVREVVYNELNDHKGHGYWRYWLRQTGARGSWTQDQVETSEGPVERLTERNGTPIDAAEQEAEDERLRHLLSSPQEQARQRQHYQDDEGRIGRIVALLPEAFLYDYDGREHGCYRLRFRPNPSYPARSIEARIFHGMSGTIWLDARYKRLARLDGHVAENVDFGYGIIGRLNKDGWFRLERTQVSETEWKTSHLEIHMSGRALLLKSIAHETEEWRGGFQPVPAGMSMAQGMKLLEQTETRSAMWTSAELQGRR